MTFEDTVKLVFRRSTTSLTGVISTPFWSRSASLLAMKVLKAKSTSSYNRGGLLAVSRVSFSTPNEWLRGDAYRERCGIAQGKGRDRGDADEDAYSQER